MSTVQTVLFVDDEQPILHVIRRELFDAPFNVMLATSPAEALSLLERHQVDMVVSDLRMQGGDGIAFLERVKTLYPTIIRIILSGHLEDSILLSSLNRGLASSVFQKPWDPEQFKADLIHLVQLKKLFRDPTLLTILNDIGSLPALPETYTRFIEALDRGEPNRILSDILSQDLPLAANILHIANTAYFSTYRIASLERALIQLGPKVIKDTVLTLSLCQLFPWSEAQKKEVQALLFHSSLVSRFTAMFYQSLHLKNLDDMVNSAALTHDIGKIILLHYFPDSYNRVVRLMEQETGLGFREAELRLNSHTITHCEIGAYFLSLWNLPSANVSAALHHHTPHGMFGSQTRLIHLISLANQRANLPIDISGEEWLELTSETPFSENERRQLWENRLFNDFSRGAHE